MLMKSAASATSREWPDQQANSLFGFVWLHAKQLYRAIKHRHGIATLTNLDDYLLADIGLTRNDVRHAMASPSGAIRAKRCGVARRLPAVQDHSTAFSVTRPTQLDWARPSQRR